MGPVEIFIYLLSAAALSLMLFFFLPLLVYSLNINHISIRSIIFLQGGLIFGGIFLLVLFLISLLPQVGPVMKVVYQVAAFSVFILVLFFPNRTGEIAGFNDSPDIVGKAAIVKLVILTALGILLGIYYPHQFQLTTFIILFIGLCFSGYVIFFKSTAVQSGTDKKLQQRDFATALGMEENIIVIIPDTFTGYRMVEVFEERPDLKEKFNGFTLYPRAIASALNTSAGISAILTGDLELPLNLDNWHERNSKSLSQSFIADAVSKGFEAVYVSNLKAKASGITTFSDENFIIEDEKGLYGNLQEYLGFWSVSLARILPGFLHKAVEKRLECWVLKKMKSNTSEKDMYKSVPAAHRKPVGSKVAFEYFINKLHKGDISKKVFLFHLNVCHPPYVFSEEGQYTQASYVSTSIYATVLLAKLLDRLKELDLYDSSLVIFAADHGGMEVNDRSAGGIFREGFSLNFCFNPLIMVKPPFVSKPLYQSEMTVWLGDVAETVREFIGLETKKDLNFPVRSLIKNEDINRKLKVPLFFKPDQEKFHSSLSNWVRRDAEGYFADYARFCTKEPKFLFQNDAKIKLYAGEDKLRTGILERSSPSNQKKLYCAIIEADGVSVITIREPGIILISDITGELEKHSFINYKKAIKFLEKAYNGSTVIIVGLHVPAQLISQIIIDRGPGIDGDDLNLNFIYVKKDNLKDVIFDAGKDNVSRELIWN